MQYHLPPLDGNISSFFSENFDKNLDTNFPILQICSNSMHSLKKVHQKYPTLTKNALGEMYGLRDNGYYETIYRHSEQVI